MGLCELFKALSAFVWDAKGESHQYYRPQADGFGETSFTDIILYALHTFGSNVTVYVPYELTTGADLEIHFCTKNFQCISFAVQAKKMFRDFHYHDLAHRNNNGFQIDTLCARPNFIPIYLFYNHYNSNQNFAARLSRRGCTIASAKGIRQALGPNLAKAAFKTHFSRLEPLQHPWEILVCRDSTLSLPEQAYEAARTLPDANINGQFSDWLHALNPEIQRLLQDRAKGELSDSYDINSPTIVFMER